VLALHAMDTARALVHLAGADLRGYSAEVRARG
jgi:hypothetical protein